jgi:predicted TIM-barrel fold metal-dependent hydrolase
VPKVSELCPRCGHPVDPQKLRDVGFLMESLKHVPRPVPAILDMHQILVRHPMGLAAQIMCMDALNIERAVLQSAPPQATSLLGNEDLALASSAHPGRFVTSWYVDPRSHDALDQLLAARTNGAKLIKLLPVSGYRLDESRFRPFWRRVQELQLALMVHTGFITARHKAEEAKADAFLSSTFGDPLQVDEPARRFPDVLVLLAHSGGAIFHEAGAQMISQHDNVWGDVSGFGLFALQRWLRLGVTVDWSKVVWGNDAPFYHYPCNLRLLMDSLDRADSLALAPDLLYKNGRTLLDLLCG